MSTIEYAPIPAERLQSIAQWLETNVRPVMHEVIAGDPIDMTEFEQEFERRDYQLEAWARLEDARAAGVARALGELATGLGKTFVAAVDVKRYRESCATTNPEIAPRILYVSHKHEINKQAAETFQEIMPELSIDFFRTRRKQLLNADLTFATIQSLYNELARFDPQYYDYIIWDESHHLEADTFKVVRDHFSPRFEHAITATVERMDGKDIKEYFGESLYKKTLPEGIAEGWLSDVDYHIVFDSAIRDEIAKGFNPKTLQEIKDLFKQKAPSEIIAQSIKDEIARLGLKDPKTIIFCESIAEANAMAELLGGVPYHSKTKDKEKVLQDYKLGATRIIATKDMFNEGVNVPDAELIIFLRATQSGSLFEQQLGRGLRRSRGKNKVYVLDFVANIERIAKVRELSEAIRRRALELGQETMEKDVIYDEDKDEEAGLYLHTIHGDFDFSSIAVDLLSKWNALRQAADDSAELLAMTNEALVELALQLKPDGALETDEIIALSKQKIFLSTFTIADRFGSIPDFQRACGFEVFDRKMSNQEIVKLALRLQPDEPLGVEDIKKLSREGKFFSANAILRRFGSLPDFQKACGHTTKSKRELNELTNDELVARALELSPDGPLRGGKIDELSKGGNFISEETVRKRFGTVKAFHRACGFVDASLSNDELVVLAKKVKPDGKLSYNEMKRLATKKRFIRPDLIKERFGSIPDFQRACGFESDKNAD